MIWRSASPTGRNGMRLRLLAILFYVSFFATPAAAAPCGGDFNAFLSAMGRDAAAAGVSRAVIDGAFAGLTLDPAVLSFDRRQRGTFRKSFEDYAATRVIPARVNRARQLRWRHGAARGDLDAGERQRHRRHGQAAGDPDDRHAGA